MRNFTRPGLALAAVLAAVTVASIWYGQSRLYTACLTVVATVTAAVWWGWVQKKFESSSRLKPGASRAVLGEELTP